MKDDRDFVSLLVCSVNVFVYFEQIKEFLSTGDTLFTFLVRFLKG